MSHDAPRTERADFQATSDPALQRVPTAAR